MILAQVATNAVASTLIPDIAKVVQDIWPNVNLNQGIAAVSAVFLIARTLRKAVPDNMQTGTLGTILKHCALEINPVQPTKTLIGTTTTSPTAVTSPKE